ncbi:hypothetical protein [Candidatus Nitrosocosmicus hydrocola]|jgi:hypothetical protein|uniref:hypothetical protein n=1 Tax=Candidatus Nitrosocosmicus hydrocola TaxID=1826872 RepID=UPI0011E5FED7|nr:hypothetical protein [Candidatus Nitrosocosmicus hydrocola]
MRGIASSIDSNEVIKKEAKGNSNLDLGEIQQIISDRVVVQKGMIEKETYEFPKSLVRNFDGNVLTIEVSENQLINFKVVNSQTPPTVRDQYLSTTEIDRGGGSGGGIQIEPTIENSTNGSESP